VIFVFAIRSPGSDLDGENIDVRAPSFSAATERAETRMRETFALASPARRAATSLRFVAVFASNEALRKAHSRAYESGVSLEDAARVAS